MWGRECLVPAACSAPNTAWSWSGLFGPPCPAHCSAVLTVLPCSLTRPALCAPRQRRAIDFVKGKPEYAEGRCTAHVCDLATEPLSGAPGSGAPMAHESADVAMLCFVLSAVAPQSQPRFIQHVCAALKPSGLLLFRDYADGDLAQKRFRPVSTSLHSSCLLYFTWLSVY